MFSKFKRKEGTDFGSFKTNCLIFLIYILLVLWTKCKKYMGGGGIGENNKNKLKNDIFSDKCWPNNKGSQNGHF